MQEYIKLCGMLRQYGRLAISRLLGTRSGQDGGFKTMIAIEEARLIQRAELTALQQLLVQKGIVTVKEFDEQFCSEIEALLDQLKQEWPEVEVKNDIGYTVKDVAALRNRSVRESWPA